MLHWQSSSKQLFNHFLMPLQSDLFLPIWWDDQPLSLASLIRLVCSKLPISLIIELYSWLQVSGSYSWTPQWFLHFNKAKCSGGWWGHWDRLGQCQSGEKLVVFPFSSTSMHILIFKISLPSHKCCLIYYLSYALFCVIYTKQFYKWFMDLEAAMKSEVSLSCFVLFLF